MEWTIKHIFNFTNAKPWRGGFCQFGFHGKKGTQYSLQYDEHWLGCLTTEDKFLWTAGAIDKGLSKNHIQIDIKYPHYVTELPDNSLLVSSNGTNKIWRISPAREKAKLFIDTELAGLKDLGNCEYDQKGSIWVNEIEGCRVWRFNLSGKPLDIVGSRLPGFHKETRPFEETMFNWIYDLRLGPDGNIYVLDSKNFSVRRIDVNQRTVSTVAGTGQPGYTGDGGSALKATLGSDPKQRFDGPFSLSVDEEANIFIGDTYNHVVRMVDHSTQQISTIAGKHEVDPVRRNKPSETDPLNLNLPKICSMDYYKGYLFIPEWRGDLVILQKKTQNKRGLQ